MGAMARYALILEDLPNDQLEHIASVLSKAFSLKANTCATILESIPIILCDDMSEDEAAAINLALNPLTLLGARLTFATTDTTDIEELPKIEWPKQPPIFKQPLQSLCTSYEQFQINGQPLLSLLKAQLSQVMSTTGPLNLGISETAPPPGSGGYQPMEMLSTPAPTRSAGSTTAGVTTHSSTRSEFTSQDLPEITPFSNPVLPSTSSVKKTNEADVSDRMDQLFPDDSGSNDIIGGVDLSNVLDQILPDAPLNPSSTPSDNNPTLNDGLFSVFLTKITDEERRNKAIPILARLGGISNEDAEKLCKKVVIPALRSVSKEEAEAAKHEFAEIGVLARIKAG